MKLLRWHKMKMDGGSNLTAVMLLLALLSPCGQEWGGDIDLGDGKLQQQREQYLSRIELVKSFVRELGG